MANEDNECTFEEISEMLKAYKNLKREALQLEFEIKHYIPVATCEDIINSMTFSKATENVIALNGKVSDKTSKIALTYADKVKRLNIKVKEDMERELRYIQLVIHRIEYYISILDEKYSDVLQKLYIEEKTFADAAKELNISVSLVKNLRRAGIKQLVSMFNLVTVNQL